MTFIDFTILNSLGTSLTFMVASSCFITDLACWPSV
jgi:hypothetical protein